MPHVPHSRVLVSKPANTIIPSTPDNAATEVAHKRERGRHHTRIASSSPGGSTITPRGSPPTTSSPASHWQQQFKIEDVHVAISGCKIDPGSASGREKHGHQILRRSSLGSLASHVVRHPRSHGLSSHERAAAAAAAGHGRLQAPPHRHERREGDARAGRKRPAAAITASRASSLAASSDGGETKRREGEYERAARVSPPESPKPRRRRTN